MNGFLFEFYYRARQKNRKALRQKTAETGRKKTFIQKIQAKIKIQFDRAGDDDADFTKESATGTTIEVRERSVSEKSQHLRQGYKSSTAEGIHSFWIL